MASTGLFDLTFDDFAGLTDLNSMDDLDLCDLARFVAKSGMSYSSVTQRSDTVVAPQTKGLMLLNGGSLLDSTCGCAMY